MTEPRLPSPSRATPTSTSTNDSSPCDPGQPTAANCGDAKAIDRNVHAFTWLPHDDGLIVETSDGIRNVAWIVKPNASARKLDLGNVDPVSATVARDGGIAFVGQRPDHYSELYYLAPGATSPTELSNDNAWTASYQLGRVEPFEWMTDIGVKADGVLTYPVGYTSGKKYPLVLDIHGGPVSTSTWNLTGIEGGALDQLLAARRLLCLPPELSRQRQSRRRVPPGNCRRHGQRPRQRQPCGRRRAA